MTLKGTKTANNLMHAFAGESQARNRYIILQLRKKKDMYKLLISSKKQQIKKKNMPKD